MDLLAEFLKKEENDKEDLTSPLLVVASAEKKEFKERNTDNYTYQVIGGVQRFSVIMKVNETEEERRMSKSPLKGGLLANSVTSRCSREFL